MLHGSINHVSITVSDLSEAGLHHVAFNAGTHAQVDEFDPVRPASRASHGLG